MNATEEKKGDTENLTDLFRKENELKRQLANVRAKIRRLKLDQAEFDRRNQENRLRLEEIEQSLEPLLKRVQNH